MPKKESISKYNHGVKSRKNPFIIYADMEALFEKANTCYGDAKKSSTTKINNHTTSGNTLFTNCSFDTTKNKIDYYRGKDCMKKTYESMQKN